MCPRKNEKIPSQKKKVTPKREKMVKLTFDDSMMTIPFLSFVCGKCKHFQVKKSTPSIKRCDAFDEIPMEIWCEENDHTQPYPGDKGIRFELLELKKGEWQ